MTSHTARRTPWRQSGNSPTEASKKWNDRVCGGVVVKGFQCYELVEGL